MAKLISELGADVLDDTQVVKKTLLTRKQKHWLIGGITSAILAAGIVVIYVLATTNFLLDYENMAYISYAYSATPNENGEITAKIDRVLPESNYPSDFRVPAKINGIRITEIGDEAFAGCTRLTKIRMTDNIVKIGDEAFAGCTNLKTIDFSKKITHIGNQAFLSTAYYENLPSDEVIAVNEVLIHVGDDLLGEKSVLVTNPSKKISTIKGYLNDGYSVFDFDSLSNITLDNIDTPKTETYKITQWMDGLFEYRDSISIVEIPETLNFVPIKAFLGCKNLTEIIIHDEVSEIHDNAFESCTSLSKFNIPDKVEYIGNNAFSNTAISIDSLPNTVKSIGDGVFKGCKNITSFTYPDSLSSIPTETFSDCTSLNSFEFVDQKVVKTIGSYAFKGTKLETFRFPQNVTSISDGVFKDCEELEYVELYNNVNGGYIPGTEYVDILTHEVTGTVAGVNRINAEAFKGCTKFTSIVLYDDAGNIDPTTKVSDHTLYFPVTLERTDTSQLGDTSRETFYGTLVEHVIFPEGIVNIGSNMFEDVTTLKDVTFVNYNESKLTNIGANAFEGCTGLTEFIVPNSCTRIDMGVWKECTNLEVVHLPDQSILGIEQQYTSINHELFMDCTKLKEVNIPEGVTQIAQKAFMNCVALEEIYIPISVSSINDDSFFGCSNLTVRTPVSEDEQPRKWEDGWDSGVKEVIWGFEK